MKIKSSQILMIVQMWGKGLMEISSGWYIVFFSYQAGNFLLTPLEHFPVLYFGFGSLLFIFAVIFFPLHVAFHRLIVPASREQVTSLESRIDAILATIGTNWEQCYLFDVDKLLDAGKTDAARKLYHQHAGGTWDEAHAALKNWPSTLLEKKLELIQLELMHE